MENETTSKALREARQTMTDREISSHQIQKKHSILDIREAAEKVIEIKRWCKEINVKYSNYETALNERIDALEQALKDS